MSTDFRDRAILALLAGGFLLLALEVLHLHRIVVHKTAVGWLPIYYCLGAFVCCLALIARLQKSREIASALFLCGIVLGIVGSLFHVRGDLSQLTVLFGMKPKPLALEPGVTRAEDDTRATSAVAPMSISGLSGVALLLAWPRRERERQSGSGQGIAIQ